MIIGYYKQGNVEIGVNKGSYEGKETTSYVVKKQKFNKETKTFEESPFWNATDLRDLMAILFKVLADSVKKFKPKPKEEPKEEVPGEVVDEGEIPF